MNTRLALSALVLVAAAGCASNEPLQVASADCKIVPATTDSATGNAPRHMTEMQQKFAQADLESSRYRMRNLQTNPANNNIEDAIRDCNRK